MKARDQFSARSLKTVTIRPGYAMGPFSHSSASFLATISLTAFGFASRRLALSPWPPTNAACELGGWPWPSPALGTGFGRDDLSSGGSIAPVNQ